MTKKKSIVIVNPNSSGGQTGKDWDSKHAILKKYFGEDIEYIFTEKANDGTTLTREYLQKGYTNIIPIGGDGMLNEVANGFFKISYDKEFNLQDKTADVNLSKFIHIEYVNSEAILTVLPGGTRNILVKSLGLPSDFEECCKVVTSTDSYKKIDIITAIVRNRKDDKEEEEKGDYVSRVILNAAEIGIGAEVINRSKMVRDRISSRLLSTITGVLATIPTYQSNVCELIEFFNDTDDANVKKLLTNMTMAMVSNGSIMGGGFNAATKAEMDDGLLDTIIVKNSGGLKILDKLADIRRGEEAIDNEDEIYYGQSQSIALLTDLENNITVSVDGEPIGILPSYFKVFPLSINVKE
ncbi:diacylglycerol/lipid kinase family protein [Candidatus Nitrosocosmicus sp. T]